MKNKIELLAIATIFFLMIMNFSAAKAEEVHVNRDSVGTNGAVNQIVVVNPAPAPVFKSRTRSVVPPSVVNNYYDRHCDVASCDRRGPVDPPNVKMLPVPAADDKFNYQDIWLMVLTILFALGLGMFIGYLIWNRRGVSRPVIVHSHGGRSSSSSSSSHGTRSVTESRDSSVPLTPAPLPSSPAPASSGQATATEEKKEDKK
jgi:hypothetical protein